MQKSPGGALVDAGPAIDLESMLADGASALVRDGDLRAGRHWFDVAYREAERTGNAEAMARAALGAGGFRLGEYRWPALAVVQERLRQAVSRVDPQSVLGLRLKMRLAGESAYGSGRPATILAVLDEVRRYGDSVARAEALAIAHHCLLGPDHGELRRELATELVSESFDTGHRKDLLLGLLWQTVDMLLDADPHAGRRLRELRESLTKEDHRAIGFVVNAIEVMLAIRGGGLDEAERLADACARRGAAVGDHDAAGWHLTQLFAIRWYQGRLAELLPVLDDLDDPTTPGGLDNAGVGGLALAAALTGDRARAAATLNRLRGNDLADLPRSSNWLVTMSAVVEAAHLLDDAGTAARVYELLSPYAHLPAMASLAITCYGSIHHALGVAALTTGDLDQAAAHFCAAIQQNLALAHWPAVVSSRRRLAEALTRRARPEDHAEAARELTTAAAEAAALGLPEPVLPVPARRKPALLTCTRDNDHWRLTLGARSAVVEHRIGMLHLAVLLANPAQEIDAAGLVAGLSAFGVAQRRGAHIFSDDRERARIAVGKAIRRALHHIAKADAEIGEHLRHTIHTGTRCAYWPV
jgi:hypothetical protein